MRGVLIFLAILTFTAWNKPNYQDAMTKELSFLALGDSYTIGERVKEVERWPVQLKDSLAEKGITIADPEIIAITGWRTDELRDAMRSHQKSDYNLVSLLIGVNNQYQGRSVDSYAPEFEELLNKAIKRAGGDNNRVFVLSIPDYGYSPFGMEKQEKISRELDAYNAVNKKIALDYGIRYFDITPISRRGLDDPRLVASDGLHPSGRQYALWVAEMLADTSFIEDLKKWSNE